MIEFLIAILLLLISAVVILIWSNLTGRKFREELSILDRIWFVFFLSAMLNLIFFMIFIILYGLGLIIRDGLNYIGVL